MKVKVKELVEGCFPVRTEDSKSDCFDLCLAEDVSIKKGEVKVVSLGVAMALPKGMSGRMVLRSSSPIKHNVMMANHIAIFDTSYSGNEDNWRIELYGIKATTIPAGTRICQFEIVPSQFATTIEKLRWLFGKIKLVKVDNLEGPSRGGIGSTDK